MMGDYWCVVELVTPCGCVLELRPPILLVHNFRTHLHWTFCPLHMMCALSLSHLSPFLLGSHFGTPLEPDTEKKQPIKIPTHAWLQTPFEPF